jgi:hypothetical protein
VDRFNLSFCDGSAFLNHHFIKMCFLPPWMDVVGRERREALFEILEQRLNEYAEMNRGLKLSIPFVCFDCRI